MGGLLVGVSTTAIGAGIQCCLRACCGALSVARCWHACLLGEQPRCWMFSTQHPQHQCCGASKSAVCNSAAPQKCHSAAVQPYSSTAVQKCNNTAVQQYISTAVQPIICGDESCHQPLEEGLLLSWIHAHASCLTSVAVLRVTQVYIVLVSNNFSLVDHSQPRRTAASTIPPHHHSQHPVCAR
jgi:hypothetical protein